MPFPLRKKSVWQWCIAGLGAIVVSIAGSAAWEMAVKPGLGHLGLTAYRILTLGSATLRDAPFSAAALNPYGLPSAMLLLLFPAVLLAIPLVGLFLNPIQRFIAPDTDGWSVERLEARSRRLQWQLFGSSAALGVVAIFVLVICGVVGQAVFIRRVHEANVQIVAPHLSNHDLLKLNAQFATVQTKAEFLALYARMKDIASANGVSLRPEVGW